MDKRPASIDPRRVNRPLFNASLADTLLSPTGVQLMLLMVLIFGCFWPATLLIGLPAAVIILIIFSDRPFRMPLRLPTDVGEPDLTTEREGFNARSGLAGLFSFVTRTRNYRQAAGILCLGYARGKSLARELWLTLDDALRHIQLMATTGGGKTEAILSVYLNSLCWGRGMCLSDGNEDGWQDKARAMISALIYALCYKREKDGLLLSQSVIQHYLPLRKMVELYRRGQKK